MKQITCSELQQMSTTALTLPRLRTHRMLHDTLADPVQRLAIAMAANTYIRPHRHPHTWELLTPLSGRFIVLQFDDHGVVVERTLLGDKVRLQEMPAMTWHAVVSLDDDGVIFEVKQGAYQPLAEADCMAWAPAEGEPGTDQVVQWYRTAQPGDYFRQPANTPSA